MPVLINFKICDNSKDCNGLKVCPVKAFYWDKKNNTIAIDEKKCIKCGLCEKSCLVGAIHLARTREEYKRIKKEIDNDPRKVSDLFVDRYGAEPISEAFLILKNELYPYISTASRIIIIECFTTQSIECLVNSIPIKQLFSKYNVQYRKLELKQNDTLMKKYNFKLFPSLLFFKDGKLMDKIEGYHNNTQKKQLEEKIKKIMSKINLNI